MARESNGISLLKKDHDQVKMLFRQLERADSKGKMVIFHQIKGALEVHAKIEEEIFYPAVKRARSEDIKDEVREGYEEHKQIKRLLAEISKITPADETYDMKLKVLREDIEHHVKEEETEMFPDARKFLKEDGLLELGAKMEERKRELEARHMTASKDNGHSQAASARSH
jgi:iron-sulfur cluster repair protein YtfE (RIC family)